MGVLDFVASIAKSTAWPAVVVFAILFLQKQIKEQLGSLTELSIGKDGFTGKWERARDQARTVLSSVEPGKFEPQLLSFAIDHGAALRTSRAASNEARVMDAWRDLEIAVQERLRRADIVTPRLGGATLIRQARTHNLITDEQARSLLGLNTMRNLAAHGRSGELTDARTEEFLMLAEAMKTVLEISHG